MPTTPSVHEQITDVVVRVLGCEPDDVVPEATFAELGTDSLTIVEIGEELGRRFDTYLSDDTIDALVTVQDAIDAVSSTDADTDTDTAPAPPSPPPATFPAAVASAPIVAHESEPALDVPPDAEKRVWSAARGLTVFGVLVGGLIGLAMTAVVAATGLSAVDLPPLPRTGPQVTASPTPTPTTPTTTAPATPEPTLAISSPEVAPGERFVLAGRFPELGADAVLDVQVREPGGSWDDFPVDARTRGPGEFRVQLYTSRTGSRELRLRHAATGQVTPTVAVRIG